MARGGTSVVIIKHCMSGHDVDLLDFGFDASREDGRNPYCRTCIRDRSQARREALASQGFSTNARCKLREIPIDRYIKRHEAKRRQEAEIARRLSAKPVERAERPYRPFLSVTTEAVFGRSPRRFRSAWRAA